MSLSLFIEQWETGNNYKKLRYETPEDYKSLLKFILNPNDNPHLSLEIVDCFNQDSKEYGELFTSIQEDLPQESFSQFLSCLTSKNFIPSHRLNRFLDFLYYLFLDGIWKTDQITYQIIPQLLPLLSEINISSMTKIIVQFIENPDVKKFTLLKLQEVINLSDLVNSVGYVSLDNPSIYLNLLHICLLLWGSTNENLKLEPSFLLSSECKLNNFKFVKKDNTTVDTSSPNNYTYKEYLFFIIHQLLENNFVGLINRFKEIRTTINDIQNDIVSSELIDEIDDQSPSMRQANRISSLEQLLSNDYVLKCYNLNSLIAKFCTWTLKGFVLSPCWVMASVRDQILGSILAYFKYVYENNIPTIEQESEKLLYKIFVDVEFKNPHLRLDIFNIIIDQEKFQLQSNYALDMINYYVSTNEFENMLSARYKIIHSLRHLLRSGNIIQRKKYKSYYGLPNYAKFINQMNDDLDMILKTLLLLIKEYQESDNNELNESIRGYYTFSVNLMAFLVESIYIDFETFSQPNVIMQLIPIITHYLDKIIEQFNLDDNQLWEMENVVCIPGCDLTSLVAHLVKIPIELAQNKYLINYFNTDKLDSYYLLGENLMGSYLFDHYQQIFWDQLLDKVKNRDPEIEVDDKFLDPLLGIPIETPVLLPETQIIMEESVIKRHLIAKEEDPFNRSPLTFEQLIEYNSGEVAKQKISDFIDQKSQWLNQQALEGKIPTKESK